MPRLKTPCRAHLTANDFSQYPIWVWNDSQDAYLPLDETSPSLEDWDSLFITAKFIAGDRQLNGYVVASNTDINAFFVLVGDKTFHFNMKLGEDFFKELKRLAAELACTEKDLLPLRYDSPVRLKVGGAISLPAIEGVDLPRFGGQA